MAWPCSWSSPFAIAARAYVLEQGRIVAEGAPAELTQDPRIREAYLGQQ